jgi:hypothetical protein
MTQIWSWYVGLPAAAATGITSLIGISIGTIFGTLFSALIARSTAFTAAERNASRALELEEKRFDYQKQLESARIAREDEVEAARHSLASNIVGRRVFASASDLAETLRPIYVRGNLSLDAWSAINDRLRQLLEDNGANDLTENAFFATKDLIDHSGFTRWFVEKRRLADPSQATDDFPMHELLITDIGGVIERLALVAEAVGKPEAAAEWRGRQDRRMADIEARRGERLRASLARFQAAARGDDGA